MQEKVKLPNDILITLILFALIPFLMAPKFVYEYSTQKHLVFTIFMLIIAFYYFTKYFSKPVKFEYTHSHMFLSFFSLSAFLSLISVYMENKYYLPAASNIAFYIVLIVFFSYLVTTRFGEDFKFIEYGLFVFMITGTIIAVDGLLNKFFGYDIFFGKYGDPSQRIALRTTIGNPNFVSDYLAQLLPISVYFTLRKNTNVYIRLYSLINVFIMFWVILLAQTRSIYLATFVGMGFAIISFLISIKKDSLKTYIKSHEFRLWLILLISVFAFLFLMFSFETPFNKGGEVIATDRLAALASVSSWDERILSWSSAIKQFSDENHKNHLFFGSGISTYPVYSVRYLAEVQQENPERFLYAWNNFKRAHNDYLQVLGETGIIGFTSIILMLISLIIIYFKTLKKEKDEDNKVLLFTLFGWSAVVMVIHAFTEFAFHMHPNLILSVFILSCAVSKQFFEKVRTINFKKGYMIFLPLMIVAIITTYFKINETASEAYFVLGNEKYNSMVALQNASKTQIPNILVQLENQKNNLQKQLSTDNVSTLDLQRITRTLEQIQSEIDKYEQLKNEYQQQSFENYEKAFEYFLKSLNRNPNFGKSSFYMSQLFISDIRKDYLTYEDLPKVFNMELPEYSFMIREFEGALDLMPFPDKTLRDTVEPLYDETLNNSAKEILITIQSLYDGINQLEYTYLSFNEKNAYRLIGRIYYNIIALYQQLKDYMPNEELLKIQTLQNKAYESFHHWENQAIYILPGGWNRFPEWEDVYYEYMLLTVRLNEVYPESEIIKQIDQISKKEGMATYYMAKKNRGIPDGSLNLLTEFYTLITDLNPKQELARIVVENYKDVYEYNKKIKEENNNIYKYYKERIDSFLEDYEFFTRRVNK